MEDTEPNLNVQYAAGRKRSRKHESQEKYGGLQSNQDKLGNRLRIDYDFEHPEVPLYNNNTGGFIRDFERSPSNQLNSSATDFSPKKDSRNSFHSTFLWGKTLNQTGFNAAKKIISS